MTAKFFITKNYLFFLPHPTYDNIETHFLHSSAVQSAAQLAVTVSVMIGVKGELEVGSAKFCEGQPGKNAACAKFDWQ